MTPVTSTASLETTLKPMSTTGTTEKTPEPKSIEKPDDLSHDKSKDVNLSYGEPTLKPGGPDVIKKGPENEDYEYYYYYYYDDEENSQQNKQSQSSDDKTHALYRWIPETWGEVMLRIMADFCF